MLVLVPDLGPGRGSRMRAYLAITERDYPGTLLGSKLIDLKNI
jgi:hypothetical protein